MVLFCQMDVTGRTEADPAAETLARNLLQYVADWKPAPRRNAVYVGDRAGEAHLESSGISVHPYEGGKLSPPTGADRWSRRRTKAGPGRSGIADWLKAGGNLLAIGLDESDRRWLPFQVRMQKAEHISAYFEPPGIQSLLAGVGTGGRPQPRSPGVIPGHGGSDRRR